MKTLILFGSLVFLFLSCSQSREISKSSEIHLQENQDSTEYEITIIDNRFDTWYILNYSKAKDHTNEYYWNKNTIAAANWDDYFRNGKYLNVVDSFIDYKPNIDYGIEVNRKLFWYFKFVQEYYDIPLYY